MITCKECNKQNTLDGTYCRGCGNALEAQAISEARIANEQLASEGFKLLAEARYEEAMMVALSVLETDPVSVQGHSLKGDALERKGDLPAAIAAYERVLELQPDATLERIKLTHARNVLAERAALAPRPNKRMALLAGLSAVVFVACVGALAAIMASKTPEAGDSASRKPSIRSDSNLSSGTGRSSLQASDPAGTRPNEPGNGGNENPASGSHGGQSSRPEDAQRQAVTDQARGSGRPAVPDPRDGASRPNPMDGSVRPAPVTFTAQPNEQRPNPQNPGRTADPDPDPVGGTPSNNGGTASTGGATGERPPRPVIDVKPSGGNPGRSGGSESTPPPTGSLAQKVKAARDAMLAGNNAEAASLFEQALAAGADPGINNQHLATCYERLGKKGEAIRCYELAASTYERRIANGDDSARTKGAAEACRQAAKALRG